MFTVQQEIKEKLHGIQHVKNCQKITFSVVGSGRDLDEGMAEAVSSLIWAAPRLQTDVAELKIIADQLTLKFGKPYGQVSAEDLRMGLFYLLITRKFNEKERLSGKPL